MLLAELVILHSSISLSHFSFFFTFKSTVSAKKGVHVVYKQKMYMLTNVSVCVYI